MVVLQAGTLCCRQVNSVEALVRIII